MHAHIHRIRWSLDCRENGGSRQGRIEGFDIKVRSQVK
jgi:hypothetical protein